MFIDLRSDTVTKPTPAMREAMAKADVGDDVYEEDPTVNKLEEYAADLLNKEAALFVPSGTMGNLIAILTHCQRGDEMIMGNLAHTFLYEAGGMAALGGVIPHTLPNETDGSLCLEDIQAAIRPEDVHFPPTRLIALENTHNRCGGVVLPRDYVRKVAEIAAQHHLRLHLDGARLFNAVVKTGSTAAELTADFDSVSFCLSKGLCAPVGSLLCGIHEFIDQARKIRKQLGGGMRQAGVLAAAGLVGLTTMIDRLAEDHQRAAALAAGLSQIPGILIRPNTPQTNMVFLDMEPELGISVETIIQTLKRDGILIGASGTYGFRLVTHHDIDDTAIQKTISVFSQVMKFLI